MFMTRAARLHQFEYSNQQKKWRTAFAHVECDHMDEDTEIYCKGNRAFEHYTHIQDRQIHTLSTFAVAYQVEMLFAPKS